MPSSLRVTKLVQLIVLVIIFGVLGPNSTATAQDAQTATDLCQIADVHGITITCTGLGADKRTIVRTLKATEDADKAALPKLAKGSILRNFQSIRDGTGAAVAEFAMAPSSLWLNAVLLALLGTIFYAYLITLQAPLPTNANPPLWKRPLSLVIGLDDRYSNSKLQAVAWMVVLLLAYFATGLLRLWGGLDWRSALNIGLEPV